MLNVILATIFAVSFFHLSGYIPRLIHITTSNNNILPTALEAIIGYAFSGFLCFFSLVVLHTPLYGAVIVLILSIYASVTELRQKYSYQTFINERYKQISFLVKLTFILVILAIYGPLLFGQSLKYHVPNIFDLPKSIWVL